MKLRISLDKDNEEISKMSHDEVYKTMKIIHKDIEFITLTNSALEDRKKGVIQINIVYNW